MHATRKIPKWLRPLVAGYGGVCYLAEAPMRKSELQKKKAG